MALRVWLPLNGTLENKGISNFSIAGTPTYYASGKLGQAFKCQGSTNIDFTVPELVGVKKYSICLWIYMESQSAQNGNWLACFRAYTQSGTIFYCSGTPSNSTNVVIFANNEKDMWSGNMSRAILDGWHHTTITSDGSKVILYIDGVEVQSNITANDGSLTGRIMLLNGSYAYLNDLRIYDHCLSPKEVKEISQGLILHYKLNSQYGLGLINKYSSEYSIGKGDSYSDGYTVTKNNDGEGYNYSFSYTGTGSDTWPYIRFPNFTFTAGKTYIWQLKVRVNSCSNYALNARQARMNNDWERSFGQVVNASLVGKGWKEYYVLQVLNEKSTRSGTEYTTNPCLELYPPSLKAEGTVYTANFDIKDVMICETDHYIPFIDNNLGCNYVVDSSGYGNDGIVTGSFTPESDSCRYDVSTKSLNGTDYIKSPLSLVDVQSFTCSFWVKPSSSNGGYSIVASNCNNPSSGFWISTNCESHALWFYNSAYADTAATSMSNDNWHHCVIVCNNKTFSMYIDGIQQTLNRTTSSSKTITINNLSIFNSYTGTSWNTKRYGNISDFRFYATALSAEDILDLYHTPANIDNLQNIHAFELKEQSGNLFAGSPMTGTMTWDATNNYYTITSNPSTSTWGIGPAVGTSPKKIIPWGMSYILTYEVYSPTAAQWYIDYNNNDPTTSLSGNDNDNGRLRTGVNVPANTWTLITYGCSNTNETKNPDHLPLYDYSTGLGPVMTNISSAITWHMRNPQWYLVDADNKEHIYESGVFQANFIKEDNQSLYTSFRNEEKAAWAHGYIEK